MPPPLAGGARISEGGHQIVAMAVTAQGGDRLKQAELDAFRSQADLQVSATINWVVIRSVVENKPSIRANLPLEEKKEKKIVRNNHPVGVTAPTKVKVIRSDEHSGIVYIKMAKVFGASMYYVQYCQMNPTDEASWIDGAQSDSCRNLEIKGLTPGAVYHFRVRCFGGGQYSQWSQIITIRIL